METEVIAFVAEFTGVDRRSITPATTLLGDLGVDGDDGDELIEAFGRSFQVDLSTCDVERYFGPEGLPLHAPFLLAWRLLTETIRSAFETATSRSQKRTTPEVRAGLETIRVADLIAAAQAKRWVR